MTPEGGSASGVTGFVLTGCRCALLRCGCVGWAGAVVCSSSGTRRRRRGAELVRTKDIDSRPTAPEHHLYDMATAIAEAVGVAVCGGRNEARMETGTLCQPVGRASGNRRLIQWVGGLPCSGSLLLRQPHQTKVSGGVRGLPIFPPLGAGSARPPTHAVA